MTAVTAASASLQALLESHRGQILDLVQLYGAKNPRVFGSVARGDATSNSDIDLLVDLTPGGTNVLLRLAGMSEDLSNALGVRVDVVAPELLRDEVSVTALAQAVVL